MILCFSSVSNLFRTVCSYMVSLCSEGPFCVLVCSHGLWSCHWAPLKRAWLQLLKPSLQVFVCVAEIPLSFLSSMLDIPSSLTLCPYERCSNPWVILLALCQTVSSVSLSALYWAAQHWTLHSRQFQSWVIFSVGIHVVWTEATVVFSCWEYIHTGFTFILARRYLHFWFWSLNSLHMNFQEFQKCDFRRDPTITFLHYWHILIAQQTH